MAATTIRELLVALGIDADTAEVKAFDSAVEGLFDRVTALVDVLKVAAAGAAAVGAALGAQAYATASSAKAIANQASALGLTTSAYQELLYAAGRYGVEAGDLADVFGQISQLASEAGRGNQQYADTFAQLGIAVEDLAGKNPDQLFTMLAEGLSRTEDATLRLTLASSILGEDSAKKLGPLLVKGAAGVAELRAEAHALGVVLDEEAVAAGAAFSSELSDLGALVTGVRNEIGLALIPTFRDLVRVISDWIVRNRELISTKIDEYARAFSDAVDAARAAVELTVAKLGGTEGLIALLERVGSVAATAATAFVGFRIFQVIEAGVLVVKGLAAALTTAGAAGAVAFAKTAAIVGAVVAVIGLLVFGIEDLIVYLRGGDSVLGRFLERFRGAEGTLGSIARAIDNMILGGQKFYAVLERLGEIWYAVFSRTSLPVLRLVTAAVYELAEGAFAALGWWIENVILPLWTYMLRGLDALIAALDAAQPRVAQLAGMLDGALGAIGGVIGVDLTGSADTAGGAAPIAPSAFAPAPGSLTAAPTTTSSSTSVAVAGNTYTFEGVGWTEEDILDLIRRSEQERARATSAALLEGAEV